MKQQVIIIHGGMSFASHQKYVQSLKKMKVSLQSFLPYSGWRLNIAKNLGAHFQVLSPRMPNQADAKYAEWKIWFERMMPYIHQHVILVGHSLGGVFLAKYLASTSLNKKILAVILVATPHNQTADVADFRLPTSLSKFSRQVDKIYLFHSPDDRLVPISEVSMYARALPSAKKIIIQHRGHFTQSRFPEIVRLIKQLSFTRTHAPRHK